MKKHSNFHFEWRHIFPLSLPQKINNQRFRVGQSAQKSKSLFTSEREEEET